ncbi:MAG TPA: site-specific integrase [Pyrinomonadaceae bacterium]
MSVFTRQCGSKGCKKKHWHYAFSIRGVRYRGSISEARTKFEADQAENRIRGDVFEGRYGRPSGARDFVSFVEEVYKPWAQENNRSWSTSVCYTLPPLCEWFKGKTFAQISPLLIEKYKRDRRESMTNRGTQRKPATVNRELQLLSTIFTLAVRHKAAATNPCKDVPLLPENNRRTRYLLDEEEPRLLGVLTGPRAHLWALVVVAIGTGMRRGDQLALTWSQVDFQRNVINVPNSKTGKAYAVPMDEEVRNILLQLRRQCRGAEYVFINPETGKPYSELKKAFGTACRLAGITGLRWHDLRHTFGTRMAEAGCSEATIADLMGHSDPATTRRYTHATDRAKHEAVAAVQAARRTACHSPATEEKRRPKLAAVNS